MKYKFIVSMNGVQKEFPTLPAALKYIEDKWIDKENPNMKGTFMCTIKLYSDINVITEGGLVIGPK